MANTLKIISITPIDDQKSFDCLYEVDGIGGFVNIPNYSEPELRLGGFWYQQVEDVLRRRNGIPPIDRRSAQERQEDQLRDRLVQLESGYRHMADLTRQLLKEMPPNHTLQSHRDVRWKIVSETIAVGVDAPNLPILVIELRRVLNGED